MLGGVLAAQELYDSLQQHQEDFRYLQGQMSHEASQPSPGSVWGYILARWW